MRQIEVTHNPMAKIEIVQLLLFKIQPKRHLNFIIRNYVLAAITNE
jgi:hypothetical protein